MKDSFVYICLIIGVVILLISYKVSNLILNNNDSLFLASLLILSLIIVPIGTYYYVRKVKDIDILNVVIAALFYFMISFCASSLPTLTHNLYNLFNSRNNRIEEHICKITYSFRESSFLGLRYQFKSKEKVYYYSGNEYLYNDISKYLKNFKIKIKTKKGIGETYILNSVELIRSSQKIEN